MIQLCDNKLCAQLTSIIAGVVLVCSKTTGNGSGLTEYSIGNPTAEEQYYVERTNRARMDPAGEADSLIHSMDPDLVAAYVTWKVDLDMFRSEMGALGSLPPLAPNAKLMVGARFHSIDQLNNAFQGHLGSDGRNAGDRITGESYIWDRWSENVYSYALSPLHGHAGFVVDWGRNGKGGMQDPRAHRDSIMLKDIREIGVGHTVGTNGNVGPEVVTQIVAREQRTAKTAFITGVVYYDLNENGLYDIGEGVSGVLATSPASSNFALTADAGGYALPVTSNGTTSVTFEIAGKTLGTHPVEIDEFKNVKADRALAYSPPSIVGESIAALGETNFYTFSEVLGATEYDVKISRTDPSSWNEGAESGTTSSIIDGTTKGYELFSTHYVATGNRAFRLTFPDFDDQSFEIHRDLLLSATSTLQFDTRFRWVTTRSKLYAEISVDGGDNWTAIYQRAGSQDSGDAKFSGNSISLSNYAGDTVRIRFRFRHHNNAYIDTAKHIGVYLDNVAVTGATQLTDSVVTSVSADSGGFAITPEQTGNYQLQVRARIPAYLPYGDPLAIEARTLPKLKLSEVRMLDAATVAIDFAVVNGNLDNIILQSSSNPQSGWTTDHTAVLIHLGSGKFQYQAAASPSDAQMFYRLTGTAN
jgi:hypothetical protein